MSLISALFSGITGLSSNSSAMEVLSDNISNVNTVGFKGGRAIFSDVLSTILNNGATTSQIGRGSQLTGVLQVFSQGSFEASTNALDMAIEGSGFFVVNNGEGNFYTRAGQFRLNDAGKVSTPTREIMQGHKYTGNTLGTTLADVDLAGVQSPPKASTTFTLGANLNATSSAGTTFSSPITMYNSAGTEMVLNLRFTRQAGNVNSWRYAATPSVGSITAGHSGSVTFDTAGQLSAVNGGTTNPTFTLDYSSSKPPAAAQTLTWDMFSSGVTNGKLTGFSSTSNNNSFVQDGFGTGTLAGLSVDSEGNISGQFNNGQTQKLYKVALADFLAPTGLTRHGANLYAESAQSGQPVIGAARTGGFGSILGSSLELSNVDLATQFATLIQTQQAFQASARMITTANSLLTEAVNLVR